MTQIGPTSSTGSDVQIIPRPNPYDSGGGNQLPPNVGELLRSPMTDARLLVRSQASIGPSGMEVLPFGIRHEVQPGETAWGLAQQYSDAFGLTLSAAQIQDANPGAFHGPKRDLVDIGERLIIPGLEAQQDATFLAKHPQMSLTESGRELDWNVRPGDTLSSIASRISDQDGFDLNWQRIYAHNKQRIGSNPNLLVPGQQLRIPGLTAPHTLVTNRSLDQLNGAHLLDRTERVRDNKGHVRDVPVVGFNATSFEAIPVASVEDGMKAARQLAADPYGPSGPVAVVQTRDGSKYVMETWGAVVADPHGANAIVSANGRGTAYRAASRELVGIAYRDAHGDIATRRFDE